MQTLAKTENPRGLTSTGLKTIALVLMVLDHIHYFFGFTGWIPDWSVSYTHLTLPTILLV